MVKLDRERRNTDYKVFNIKPCSEVPEQYRCNFRTDGFSVAVVVSVQVDHKVADIVGKIIDVIRLSIKMSVENNKITYCSKSSSKQNPNFRFSKTTFEQDVNHYQNSTFKSKTSCIVMVFQYVDLNKEKKMGKIRKLKNISKGLFGFWLEVMAYYGSS